jgi:hypothetical protein
MIESGNTIACAKRKVPAGIKIRPLPPKACIAALKAALQEFTPVLSASKSVSTTVVAGVNSLLQPGLNQSVRLSDDKICAVEICTNNRRQKNKICLFDFIVPTDPPNKAYSQNLLWSSQQR